MKKCLKCNLFPIFFPSVAETGYSTNADVKQILDIDASDITYDDELDACITSGDGLIDSILKFHGFTVPLIAPIPQNVQDASKYFAAAYFRERRGPSGEVSVFYNRAMDFLNAYIQAEKEGTLKRV